MLAVVKKLLKKTIYRSLRISDNLSGVSNYNKFVIITRSRTGSNFLISLLNSNRKIRAFGEIYNIIGKNNCQKIYADIFPKKSKKTIGFKIFYYHPIDSNDKSIWDILKNDQTFKIIHLQRRNLLRVHISRLIAGKTDDWKKTKNKVDKLKGKKVLIDLGELTKDFETTNTYIQKANNDFKNHEMINVFYEDLIDNKDAIMTRVFNFLNVENCSTQSKLLKQNPEKIEDLVLNYKELKDYLIRSQYSDLLTD